LPLPSQKWVIKIKSLRIIGPPLEKITDRGTGGVNRGLANHYATASGVLNFWRDETAHGMDTTIEAQASLAQLLRFAQLAHEN
jgi:hypothetical protein